MNDQWYLYLVEDCQAIITETIFNSRWALVEGYHQLGERIATDENWQKNATGNGRTLKDLAICLDKSERTLYYAVRFYDTYPELNSVPEGKNISWNKLITKYLPDGNGKTHEISWREYADRAIRNIDQMQKAHDAADMTPAIEAAGMLRWMLDK